MPAYLVANLTIHDPEAFQAYVAAAPALVARHGGKYIVRAGNSEILEGHPKINRTTIIEFPSMQHAKDFYTDPDYQPLVQLRQSCAETHIFCIEGYAS